MLDAAWVETRFDGEWIKGKTAGGCRNYLETFHTNPQYMFELSQPDDDDPEGRCTVIIALMQKYRRMKQTVLGTTNYYNIGFIVYGLDDEHHDE